MQRLALQDCVRRSGELCTSRVHLGQVTVATRRFDLAATFERMVPQTRPVGKGTKRDPSERGGRGGDTATADEASDPRAFGDTNDDLPRADAIRLPW